MKPKITKLFRILLPVSALVLSLVFGGMTPAAYDGPVNQGNDHSGEYGMYRYDLDISLDNPCNSGDMDKDAVYLLWFDFDYKDQNGRGSTGTYRLDMSWKSSRNLNGELLKKHFIRNNDNACFTKMSVWVPGIVTKVRVFLNMDGGERLAFTVKTITLNGFRINTDTDYVSSAYYDSSAEIPCRVPPGAAICPDNTIAPGAGIRDQFNGLLFDQSCRQLQEQVNREDYSGIYHWDHEGGQTK